MPLWLSDVIEKSNSFIPHGHCYLWIPSLLWLHVVSDALIGAAYVGISLILYLLVRKIRLPFSPVFIAFGLFIGLCGLTHFMKIWTVWNPDYWAEGLLKAATAAASVATAIGLYYIRPQVEELVHAARLSEERREQLETTNAELQALYQKVKEMDELKTQFFANVSHELRTPLALILGPAERMLDDDNLTPDQKRQLSNISHNSKTLLKQVNDLLDVAQLEEGQMPVKYVRMDLALQFRKVTDQFAIAAEHRQIQYTVSAPDQLAVEADPDMLERVCINLLSNAFKFTPDGGAIHADLKRHQDELVLSISDTGPGISPDQHHTIFERFRQADGGSTRKRGGTGLGLAIVKDFVRLHGGRIELQSEPGQGATFTVRLPANAPASANVNEWAGESLQPTAKVALDSAVYELESAARPRNQEGVDAESALATILVVEDTLDMSAFIADTLRGDYNIVTAADGQEGLDKALALRPDLIVTDVMMPRMSGDQLVAELRKQPVFDTTPVLLLTAKADDDLRVRLLQNGAQDYLIKPFLPRELLARAANLISLKRTGDTLRAELTSASSNIEALAEELALRHRQLTTALSATEVAREQAEQASQVKSHFLAMISHEMRTPLSTIQMNAQLLNRQLDGALTTQTQVDRTVRIERMVRATQQLATLIEGLLQYARVESGKLASHLEPVDIVALAREVIDVGQLEVASSNVNLALAPTPANLEPIVTDPRLLRVILSNLVSNALKFTKEGSVTLAVSNTDQWYVFEVRDTGVGIPKEDLGRIFLPFEQLEPLRRKNIPGVGLGLALIKQIVDALSGKVEVTSEADVGSTFRVILPRQR